MFKKISFILLFWVTLNSSFAQLFNVATYNLRYDNSEDTLDRWKIRYPYIASMVQFYDFDIFGTQEGLYLQLQDLKAELKEYDYIGVGRDDGKIAGEHSAIFYRKTRFQLVESQTFWLSEHTECVSKGWDAALPRICTWGKFSEISTGFTFYFFNVHFDHRGKQARLESAKLMLSKIQTIAGQSPAILTGDFNVDEKDECYAILNTSDKIKDAFDLAKIRFAPNGTFNGFEMNKIYKGRIDHIFLTKDFKVNKYGILTNTYKNHYPSDHFPVFIQLDTK